MRDVVEEGQRALILELALEEVISWVVAVVVACAVFALDDRRAAEEHQWEELCLRVGVENLVVVLMVMDVIEILQEGASTTVIAQGLRTRQTNEFFRLTCMADVV